MKWLNRLMGETPAAFVEFVSPAKLEKLLEVKFEEFGDDSPEAKRWQECLEQVKALLCQFSHDEEMEGADGSPGFILEDLWQGVLTIGMEFNDPALLSKTVLEGLAQISSKGDTAIEFGITFYLGGKDPDLLDMETLVIRKGLVYAPNSRAMKKAVESWG